MDESEEYFWTRDSGPAEHSRRWTFSVAFLFRGITLLAMTFGWFILVTTASSSLMQWIVLLVAAVVAVIVGYRRVGKSSARCRAAFLFFGGSVIITIYSGYIAHVLHNPISRNHPWAAVDQMFSVLPIILTFPIAIVVLVFMLRAWVWSAHDQTIHKH